MQCDKAPLRVSLESTGDRAPDQSEVWEGFLEEVRLELIPASLRMDEQDRISVSFGGGGHTLYHQSLPLLPCPWSESASVEEPGTGARAMEPQELACALTSASWTSAGAASPGPSDWRDLRGKGRCHPAP